jgi:hypothetical protein
MMQTSHFHHASENGLTVLPENPKTLYLDLDENFKVKMFNTNYILNLIKETKNETSCKIVITQATVIFEYVTLIWICSVE